jgi:hypothetical protein
LTFAWNALLGKYLFIFLEGFLHGSCLVKNLTSIRSFPYEEKSAGPGMFLKIKEKQKRVRLHLYFAEASLLTT